MDKKDLAIADIEMHIDNLKSNISRAKRDIIHAKYQIDDKEKSIVQWVEEIQKKEDELKQIQGG